MQAGVKDRIARWGRQATASQLGNPGIQVWVDPESDSVVGYRQVGQGAVTVGDPIGPLGEWPGVIQRFERQFQRVTWFGISEDFPVGHRLAMPLGFETQASATDWAQILKQRSGLRYQIRRSVKKGVCVIEVDPWVDLTACLASWRSQKMPWRLYFMTDPEIVSHRSSRRAWAAVYHHAVVGYLVASPVPNQRYWLFEQWIRDPKAPNGVIEQLVDAAIAGLPDGAFFTMGLCPFSVSPILPESRVSRGILGVCRVLLKPVYRCASLTRFKLKFQFPVHRRIRLAFSRYRYMPLCFVDVILAFIIKP